MAPLGSRHSLISLASGDGVAGPDRRPAKTAPNQKNAGAPGANSRGKSGARGSEQCLTPASEKHQSGAATKKRHLAETSVAVDRSLAVECMASASLKLFRLHYKCSHQRWLEKRLAGFMTGIMRKLA